MALTRPNEVLPDAAGGERNAQTQLWHGVLAVHGGVFGRLNRALSREFGITLAKYDVLAQLYHASAGLNQRDLSRQLKVTDGNVTGLVKRLIADGLISREESASDRRAFLVQITQPGRALYRAAQERHDALLADFFGVVSPERLSETRVLLDQLSQALDLANSRETE